MGRGIRSNKPKKLGESAESPTPDQQHHDADPRRSTPAYYAVCVLVSQGKRLLDGTVAPWAAIVCAAEGAPHSIEPREATGSTLAALRESTYVKLEELSDEIGMMVGSRWMIEGDHDAWIALRDSEGLSKTPRGESVDQVFEFESSRAEATEAFSIKYMRSLQHVTDPVTRRILFLLARLTRSPFLGKDSPILGVDIQDTDILGLARRAATTDDTFRSVLRSLRDSIPMDVLEHPNGLWEIVYGPQYTDPKLQKPLPKPVTDATVRGSHSFNMPGWDHYSTWGYDEGDGYMYAQLYRNHDNRDERPTIWITPTTGYSLSTIDQLAEAIAFEIAPFEAVPPAFIIIKNWLTKHPFPR